MKCYKCDTTNNDENNFCGNCGNKIKSVKATILPNAPFDKLEGTWTVTTEGDCEGLSTRHLGTYTGKISEIAKQLAHCSYYSLHFSPVNDQRMENKDRKQVNISFINDFGLTKMKNLFAEDDNVTVKDCNYYHTYTLKFED